jgi:transposase
MDQIGWIRRLHRRENKSEREIARITGLSRNTVAKWLHGELVEPKYRRAGRPNKLAPYGEALQLALAADSKRPKHERRTAKALYAQIKAQGYEGGYTRVTDHIRRWRAEQGAAAGPSCRWPSSSARPTSSTEARKAWWSAASTTARKSRT